jgi:type I restriction enzyme, S subunit
VTGIKQYDQYKDSGIEWVGAIPVGWETRPLFAVVRENTKSNKAGLESNLLSLSYGRIVRKDIAANDGLLPASFDTYQVINRSDIVLRLTDLQNDKRSLRSAISSERGIITSAYLALTPTRILSNFLSYLLRAYDLQKVFYSMGGGLRQSMKFSDMKWLPVVLPPESTQRAITEYLDRETAQIDDLIGKQEELLELLAEKRRAIITHAVTKGLDPTAATKPSGIPWLGDIPSHWAAVPLKWLSQLTTGITPPTANEDNYSDEETPYPWIRPEDLDETGRPTQASRFLSLEAWKACRPVKADSVLICCIGATLGKAGLIRKAAVTNQQITAIESEMVGAYLFAALGAARQEIEAMSVGNTLPILNMSRLGMLSVPVPPAQEQLTIAQYVETKSNEIDQLSAKSKFAIQLLRERRSALISAAVTGRINVEKENS